MQPQISPLLADDYVAGLYSSKVPAWSVFRSYIARVSAIAHAARHDLVWVEKEMLPWIPAFIEFGLFPGSVPMIVDYDDATFHRYDLNRSRIVRGLLGEKIDVVMGRADLVLVGNAYLAERARCAGARRVEFLPTVVDIERYHPRRLCQQDGPLTIGWIGNPATAKYLHLVDTALRHVTETCDARVVAVGANPDQVAGLPAIACPWSESTEASDVQAFDIGIMPLPDEPFERGKCGYKLIQYMACGKPVVASAIGVNTSIVEHGVNGFLVSSDAEWKDALRRLVDDPALRERMGVAGRARVEASYSLQVTAPRLEALLRSVVS
jgi:glycosyltransferase involved in cell wall biosynthesis